MRFINNFFGSTTVGKKGQIVIPMETRNKMKWDEGEKLLVFGLDNGMVVLTKLEKMQKIAAQMEKKLAKVNKYLKNTK